MLTQFEYDVLYLRCQMGTDKDPPVPFDAQEIADKLATSANAVARASRSLKSGGYLDQYQNPTLPGRQMIHQPVVFAKKFNTYQSKFLPTQN